MATDPHAVEARASLDRLNQALTDAGLHFHLAGFAVVENRTYPTFTVQMTTTQAELLAEALAPADPAVVAANTLGNAALIEAANEARALNEADQPDSMVTVKCDYANGDTITTQFSGTSDDARKYFVGQVFNIGSVEDNMQQCVSITVDGATFTN